MIWLVRYGSYARTTRICFEFCGAFDPVFHRYIYECVCHSWFTKCYPQTSRVDTSMNKRLLEAGRLFHQKDDFMSSFFFRSRVGKIWKTLLKKHLFRPETSTLNWSLPFRLATRKCWFCVKSLANRINNKITRNFMYKNNKHSWLKNPPVTPVTPVGLGTNLSPLEPDWCRGKLHRFDLPNSYVTWQLQKKLTGFLLVDFRPPGKLTCNMTMVGLHHEWRCTSYWKWGIFQPVMLVFRGVMFTVPIYWGTKLSYGQLGWLVVRGWWCDENGMNTNGRT